MANQGVVNIGLKVDYQKSLDQMVTSFKSKLNEISNEAKKTTFSRDIVQQVDAIDGKVEKFATEFRGLFDDINKQNLDSSKFTKYQEDATAEFNKLKTEISDVASKVSALATEVGMLNGSDFASGIIAQFSEIKESVLETYKGVADVFDLINKPKAVGEASLAQYKKTLEVMEKYAVAESMPKDTGAIVDKLLMEMTTLKQLINNYDLYKAKLDSLPESSTEFSKIENALARTEAKALAALDTIIKARESLDPKQIPDLAKNIDPLIERTSAYMEHLEAFRSKASAIIQETERQTQGAVSTFQIKNGAIHVPIKITTEDKDLEKQIEDALQKAQAYADNKSVVAKIDIAKKAKDEANDAIKAIQEVFTGQPVKIAFDKDAFIAELSETVNSSLGKITSDTAGINVNSELEALIGNLQKVSESLSGGEGFKLGLDEAQINRITSAIENMANMIQRAFGVASDSDIAKQWSVIEGKFNSAAGAEGKLLKSNKDHLAVIREIAIEYQKYLDMGGKNDFSALTKHKYTVNNLEQAYQELGKAAEEAARKQEQVAKPKASSSKATTQDKEAIKGTTAANAKLETQAGKTSTALENEGKAAQSASEKFRKLAKEKGAAVVANRELAKAAKETADALEREAKARQAGAGKTPKSAVDSSVYLANSQQWQNNIKSSLTGKYEEVYGAKIDQAANGVVKFTAYVRDANEQWKVLTATINGSGEVISQKIQDATDKQVIGIEKQKAAMEQYREALANALGGEEPTSFNRNEVEEYIQLILEASEGLDKFKIKKVTLNESGQLSIATELREANGEIKTFTANFNSVEDVLDLITSGTKNFAGVLNDAFNSGKFTISRQSEIPSITEQYKELLSTAKELNNIKIKIAGLDSQKNSDQISELVSKYLELYDVYRNLYSAVQDSPDFAKLPADAISSIDSIFDGAAQKIDEVQAKISDAQRNTIEGWQATATKSLADFEFKNQDNTYIAQVKAQIDELRNSIANIDSKEALDNFNRKLGAIKTTLNDLPKDNRLGKVLDPSKTFDNIGEVRESAMSLLSTLGKVNEKSIKVSGADKLTAEVRLANGEIHKMNVSLDSKGFARYVDAGIVQFGRLRSAAEGVFKSIYNMMRIYISPYRFIQYFRRGLDKVKEMDTAITELRKVSDAPMSDISAYFDDAAESAKELGSSIKDMIGATADWARLGMKYCSVIW